MIKSCGGTREEKKKKYFTRRPQYLETHAKLSSGWHPLTKEKGLNMKRGGSN